LTNALAIHDLCRDAGIPCWVGGMLESAVGARACVALAMLDNFTYPADIFPSRRFYRDDLARPELELIHNEQGVLCAKAPDIAGTGAMPQPERLRQCTVAQAIIE
jgi:O-succinylbenzoate synthase